MDVDEKYRFYLCEQQTALHWKCKKTTYEEGTDSCSLFTQSELNRATKMIPISGFIPRFLDGLIIRSSLRPQVKIDL